MSVPCLHFGSSHLCDSAALRTTRCTTVRRSTARFTPIPATRPKRALRLHLQIESVEGMFQILFPPTWVLCYCLTFTSILHSLTWMGGSVGSSYIDLTSTCGFILFIEPYALWGPNKPHLSPNTVYYVYTNHVGLLGYGPSAPSSRLISLDPLVHSPSAPLSR